MKSETCPRCNSGGPLTEFSVTGGTSGPLLLGCGSCVEDWEVATRRLVDITTTLHKREPSQEELLTMAKSYSVGGIKGSRDEDATEMAIAANTIATARLLPRDALEALPFPVRAEAYEDVAWAAGVKDGVTHMTAERPFLDDGARKRLVDVCGEDRISTDSDFNAKILNHLACTSAPTLSLMGLADYGVLSDCKEHPEGLEDTRETHAYMAGVFDACGMTHEDGAKDSVKAIVRSKCSWMAGAFEAMYAGVVTKSGDRFICEMEGYCLMFFLQKAYRFMASSHRQFFSRIEDLDMADPISEAILKKDRENYEAPPPIPKPNPEIHLCEEEVKEIKAKAPECATCREILEAMGTTVFLRGSGEMSTLEKIKHIFSCTDISFNLQCECGKRFPANQASFDLRLCPKCEGEGK